MALTIGLDVARSSLSATAEQIAVVSRNVGRVGDADATRKSVSVVTGPGSGVRVARIDRSYDPLLLHKALTSNSAAQSNSAVSDAIDQLNATIGDTSLERSPASLIGKLSSALLQYSASPSNASLAYSAVLAAKDVSNALNAAAATVSTVRSQADADIASSVDRVNSILSQFEVLNKEIVVGTRAGRDVTDVADARDGLLKTLSTEIGIRTVERGDGDLAIYTDSNVTMFDKIARKVTFQPSGNIASGVLGSPVYVDGVPVAGTPHAMAVDTGKIAGLVAVRDELAPRFEDQLDEIARGLIEAFAETDQSSVPSLPAAAGLFTYPGAPTVPTSGTIVNGLASTLSINGNVDPAQGGLVSRLRDGGISNPGNPAYLYNSTGAASYETRIQGLVDQISAVRSYNGSAEIGTSASLVDYASSSVSWLQTLRQTSREEAEYRTTVAERATAALSKDTGVSLDEEMARMLELERTYQASSRLVTAIDGMLETLINAVR